MDIADRLPRNTSSPSGDGPSIYKCDQLRKMLESALRNRSKLRAGMDVVKFLEQYLPVRNDSSTKAKAGSYAVGTRLHAFCRQLSESLGLNKDFVQERIVHGFVHDESQLQELCDQLAVVRDHYDMAISLLKDEPTHRPVTIRIGTTNLINMRLLPAVLDAARHQFQKAHPNVSLRFEQTILDSQDLMSRMQSSSGLDAIVACCLDVHARRIPEGDLVASLPLQCCLLRQRVVASGGITAIKQLPEWEAVRNTPMVALTSRHKHFDIPWPIIEGIVSSIDEVPTLLEAHARVAAGDSWTLSYRELLDDSDERTLEALDLPEDSGRDTTLIVAVIPRAVRRKKHRTSKTSAVQDADSTIPLSDDSPEKQAALAILKSCLRDAFAEREALKQEAANLTRCLSRFTHTYHISDFALSKGLPPERLWFCGRLQLECTANGNLRGSVTVGNPAGEPMQMRVFGRPLKFHDGKVWNLNWRSSDPREESGTTNLFVTKSDMENGDALVGHWVGRSSWTDGEIRPTGGPVILHSRAGLTVEELGHLVEKHENTAIPNIRLLTDRFVPSSVEISLDSSTEHRKPSSRPTKIRDKVKSSSDAPPRKNQRAK